MAKSKNHTSHHQNRKDHRNGIKRPKAIPIRSFEGQDRKFVFNLRKSRRNNRSRNELSRLRAPYNEKRCRVLKILENEKIKAATAREIGQALLRKHVHHCSNAKFLALKLSGDRVRATLNRLAKSKK